MFGVIGEDLFRAGLFFVAIILAAYLCFWILSILAGKKLKAVLEREYGKKRH
jgi:hypothetical protein